MASSRRGGGAGDAVGSRAAVQGPGPAAGADARQAAGTLYREAIERLTVSRGLTEAMGGMLKPEETPGGGLTMAVSLPAVHSPGQVSPAWPGKGPSLPNEQWRVPQRRNSGRRDQVAAAHTQAVRIGGPRRGKHLAH